MVTSAAGLGLLVYGLTRAAAGPDGVSHWGDALTIGSLVAAGVLLVSFVLIEMRSRHPELPLNLLKSRRRSGAYLMMLLLGSSLFTVFFFVTIYIETVLGYSPIKAGVAWPAVPGDRDRRQHHGRSDASDTHRRAAAAARRAAAGGRGLPPAVAVVRASSYWTGMLPSVLLVSAGMGLLFVPLTLMVVNHVAPHETGAASSLLNTTQQVGGAIGLAAIGTIAWTSVADSISSQMAAGAAAAGSAAAGAASTEACRRVSTTRRSPRASRPGLLVAAGVIFASFFVGLVTTWTPGRLRLSSARHDQVPSCDEVLGTCEAVEVA